MYFISKKLTKIWQQVKKCFVKQQSGLLCSCTSAIFKQQFSNLLQPSEQFFRSSQKIFSSLIYTRQSKKELVILKALGLEWFISSITDNNVLPANEVILYLARLVYIREIKVKGFLLTTRNAVEFQHSNWLLDKEQLNGELLPQPKRVQIAGLPQNKSMQQIKSILIKVL